MNKGWNGKRLVAGVLTLVGIALVSLLFIIKSPDRKSRPAEKPPDPYIAELASATGMVFVGKPGRTEWHQASAGTRLMEGDLVQTDASGEASIRYSDGPTVSIQANTIFTVRNAADGSMEISVPFQEGESPAAALEAGREPSEQPDARSGSNAGNADAARSKESNPFIKLDRVVPFGRSLELIGSVEAGSRLTANGEIVDVAGDGSFKHFTDPFPANARRVRIILKVTNLAGRTRMVTTTHDFAPQGEEN